MNNKNKNKKIQRIKINNHNNLNPYTTNLKKQNVYFKPKINLSFEFQKSSLSNNNQHQYHYYHDNVENGSRINGSLRAKSYQNNLQNNRSNQQRQRQLFFKNSNKQRISKSTGKINQRLNIPHINQKNNIEVNKPNYQTNQNYISGTNLGSLSTKQILKKYQLKRIKDSLRNKQFLDNHIKNLKVDDYDDMDLDIQQYTYRSTESYNFNMITALSKQNSNNNISVPRMKLESTSLSTTKSQDKLIQLLDNRLSDRDYVDFNVKLLSRREVQKRKYFSRYFNILSKKRNEGVQQ